MIRSGTHVGDVHLLVENVKEQAVATYVYSMDKEVEID